MQETASFASIEIKVKLKETKNIHYCVETLMFSDVIDLIWLISN